MGMWANWTPFEFSLLDFIRCIPLMGSTCPEIYIVTIYLISFTKTLPTALLSISLRLSYFINNTDEINRPETSVFFQYTLGRILKRIYIYVHKLFSHKSTLWSIFIIVISEII